MTNYVNLILTLSLVFVPQTCMPVQHYVGRAYSTTEGFITYVLLIFSILHVDLFSCGTIRTHLSSVTSPCHSTPTHHSDTFCVCVCVCVCGTSAFTQLASLNGEGTRIHFNYIHIPIIIIIIIIIYTLLMLKYMLTLQTNVTKELGYLLYNAT